MPHAVARVEAIAEIRRGTVRWIAAGAELELEQHRFGARPL
jgi:hypothetical protein